MLKDLSDQKWLDNLNEFLTADSFKVLDDFLDGEYASKTIFPPREEIFTAFNLTPFDDVKVLILGQDPYHGPNQAHGLAFS